MPVRPHVVVVGSGFGGLGSEHLVFLIGFRNRVVVMVNWAWNYLTWDRAARVILDDGSRTPTGQPRA